ncbi:hypothetical protein BN12_2730007 [Nostocoides japonicum T1-X7]|uniref:Uncharacterized protein n=1 Tax=Nostocoides japonicum T1-X7 TaxID=1194083 RepID=A0A077LZM0_9MICO|nr:hypothetical protein BN12_2730007 [Tetrasphaera japonica T1-X7]
MNVLPRWNLLGCVPHLTWSRLVDPAEESVAGRALTALSRRSQVGERDGEARESTSAQADDMNLTPFVIAAYGVGQALLASTVPAELHECRTRLGRSTPTVQQDRVAVAAVSGPGRGSPRRR